MTRPQPSPRRIVVLRHGRTAWNVDGRFQGRRHPADPPLDDVGRAQAAAAADALTGIGATVLLTSPLRRAAQTAQAVARVVGLPPVPDERLEEQSFGRWEGLTRAEVEQAFPAEYAVWLDGVEPVREGGETRGAVGRRAAAAVADLPAGATAILVTHGAAAAALVAELLGLGEASRRVRGLGNCHTSTLVETVEGWTLQSHNLPTVSA